MIVKMIRNKMLSRFKIRGQYYHIIVDGTGLATSRKKYNENCLIKNKTDKNGNEYQEYSTYVLEAKLVIGDMVFSIGSEFVENERENVDKQDCETKAFKRLAEKIKKEYPKLRIIISGDALYASKPVMDICKEYNWKYIIRFKEGAIPTLYREFETVVKIENEGFYIQKNGTFDIGHLYSKDTTAIKVHYLMIKIAHIIRQLLENEIKEIKELKLKLKEISQHIKNELISTIPNLKVLKKVQLRFDSIV